MSGRDKPDFRRLARQSHSAGITAQMCNFRASLAAVLFASEEFSFEFPVLRQKTTFPLQVGELEL
jgi:hypothetical protein